MEYSFMSFSCPDLTLEAMLSLAKKFGYDAIEPRAESKHRHGIETDTTAEVRAAIKAQVAVSDIDICCLATSCRYADPVTVDENIESTHQFIDLAGDIGVSRLRIFGGKLGEGVSREAAIDGVAQALGLVADHAATRDVTLCLETHDDWCDPVHVAAVMKQVNHAHIAVNWDIMHPVRAAGSTMDQAFETLQSWVRHVHFHDGTGDPNNHKMLPIGEGIIDHKRALELLKANGYEGFCSGEWINWEPYEVHLPRELGMMRRYESEI